MDDNILKNKFSILILFLVTVNWTIFSQENIYRPQPGAYTFTVKHSGLMLDNFNFPINPNQDVSQMFKNNLDRQKWLVDSVGDGYYRISSLKSGLALGLYNCDLAQGAEIRQSAWDNADCQKWSFIQTDGTFFKIMNKASRMVVEVENGNMLPSANIIQKPENTTDSQLWKIEKIQAETILPGIYNLSVKHSQKMLDFCGTAGNVYQWGRNFKNCQKWKIDQVSEGFYKISDFNMGRVLEVAACSHDDGTNVQINYWQNKACQLWELYKLDENYYVIINKETRKVLSVEADGTTDGTNVSQNNWNAANSQKWKLEKQQTPVNDIVLVPKSSIKINQLVGDWDIERNEPTQSRTYERYKLANSDLGVPFEHKGKTFLVFGDVFHTTYSLRGAQDPIGFTTDTNPDDGLKLDFVTRADGQFKQISIAGLNMGGFGVGIEGVSWNDIMYVYASNSAGNTMNFSVLAKSYNDGVDFTRLYTLPASKFINLSVVKTKSDSNFPEPIGTDIQIMVGSGAYRASFTYLAYQRGDQIENLNSIQYFMGIGPNGLPQWSSDSEDAVPIFENNNVGELSLSYNQYIKKWIVMYYGAVARFADNPWGPYSDQVTVFDGWVDDGFCHFLRFNDCGPFDKDIPQIANDNAGLYGPFQFENFSKGNEKETTVYWTFSTWHPYTSILMKSIFRKIDPVPLNIEKIEPGIYSLYVKHSNKALYNSNFDGTSGSNNISQWTRNDQLSQKWKIEPIDQYDYKITSLKSGMVMETKDCANLNGTNVQQGIWANKNCQKWRFERIQGDEHFRIVNRQSGRSLEVAGDLRNDGGNVQIWDKNEANWQRWRLERSDIKPGVYKIEVKYSNKVLDNNNFLNDGDNIVKESSWNDSIDQKWQIDSIEDGYYRIISLKSQKYLSVDACDGIIYSTILQKEWSNSDCQKWMIISLPGGYYKFINKAVDKVMQVNIPSNNLILGSWETYSYRNEWKQWKPVWLGAPVLNTGLENLKMKHKIQFTTFPNPVKEILNLKFTSNYVGKADFVVFDQMGKKIRHGDIDIQFGENQHILNTNEWGKGLFLLQLTLPESNESISVKVKKD